MRPSSRSLWTQESAHPTSLPCPKHCHFNLCPQQQQGWHKAQGWGGWEAAHTGFVWGTEPHTCSFSCQSLQISQHDTVPRVISK